MKLLLAVLTSFTLLLLSPTEGWSLPPCPEKGVWNNCFGTYKSDDGSRYVGEWNDDQSHGQGTETYANGDKYVGEFKDGKAKGKGVYTYANGDKLTGEFTAIIQPLLNCSVPQKFSTDGTVLHIFIDADNCAHRREYKAK